MANSLPIATKQPANPPPFGTAVELAAGLYWAAAPLSFIPHCVNIWLLADDDGWVVVDAGENSKKARDSFEALHESLGNPQLDRHIGTHGHIDHLGLSGWLCAKYKLPLLTTSTEWLQLQMARRTDDVPAYKNLHRYAGAPDELINHMDIYRTWFASNFENFPDTYTPLHDGQELLIGGRVWHVMTAGGHSIDQIALYCPTSGLLIGADHLLPNITPFLPTLPYMRRADPVQDQFNMLDRFCALPEDTLVLPSHGVPFRGIAARSAEIRNNHNAAMNTLRNQCNDWTSCHSAFITARGRPMAPDRLHLALSQTVSHMTHMALNARLETRMEGQTALFRKG